VEATGNEDGRVAGRLPKRGGLLQSLNHRSPSQSGLAAPPCRAPGSATTGKCSIKTAHAAICNLRGKQISPDASVHSVPAAAAAG
jgi:hypothetical protein